MVKVKELILKYLTDTRQFVQKDQLKKKLKIKGEEQTTSFYDALNVLEEEGSLFFDEKKGYHLFENSLGVAFGEIEINKAGNGFVHTGDGYTIFIEKKDLDGALAGDKVIVSSITPGNKDDYRAKVERIVKRKTGNVIFEVVGNGYDATLVAHNKNEDVNILVNKNKFKNLVDGELLLIKVGTDKVNNQYIAEIDSVIGHKNDPGIDLKLIYAKYEIPVEFSKEALKEAEKLPTEVSEEEIIGRVDLRDKQIVTIDCDDTKDRDDAIYVEKLDNGNYKLYTSISHISNYIKKDSSLYKEASTRSTSHYPNNTCNPMFPPKVSNGICSLNENVDRLTRTCEMEFDKFGNLIDYKVYLSVINSKKAMKYSEVNKVLDGTIVEGYEPFTSQLKLMDELCNLLEENRKQRNCIDFDIPDIKMVQNIDGEIEKFTSTGMGKAERIIENFMLATGTSIAINYSWLPFIYRVHEEPEEITVRGVIDLLRASNFNIPKYQNINEATIINILDRVKSSDELKIVRTLLLKSMKRARYDTYNVGHFALQLPYYSHFTSPIRRFTDFRIHTLIDELDTMDYSRESIKNLESELTEIAKYASGIEKTAKDIENEAMLMAMAEYMEKHIGQYYEAVITEVYPHGMFAKTKNLISGKIEFKDMLDDKYFFDYKKKAVVGKKDKKRYQIGSKVVVLVKDANKNNRTINFEMGTPKTLKKTL